MLAALRSSCCAATTSSLNCFALLLPASSSADAEVPSSPSDIQQPQSIVCQYERRHGRAVSHRRIDYLHCLARQKTHNSPQRRTSGSCVATVLLFTQVRAKMHQDCAGWRFDNAVLQVADTQTPQTSVTKLIFRNLRGISGLDSASVCLDGSTRRDACLV